MLLHPTLPRPPLGSIPRPDSNSGEVRGGFPGFGILAWGVSGLVSCEVVSLIAMPELYDNMYVS